MHVYVYMCVREAMEERNGEEGRGEGREIFFFFDSIYVYIYIPLNIHEVGR